MIIQTSFCVGLALLWAPVRITPIHHAPDTPINTMGIHQVVIHLEYQTGVGGAVYPVYNPYILYKDGSIYKHPVTSPMDLDTAASRKDEARKWGTWKLENGILKTMWPHEKEKYRTSDWKVSSYKQVRTPSRGETVGGAFKALSGGGNTSFGGDIQTFVSTHLCFSDAGKFTLNKAAGTMGASQWETHYGKDADAGTYEFDSYTIEMKFNSGKKERRFFYFYPDSKQYFGIGKSVYTPLKN